MFASAQKNDRGLRCWHCRQRTTAFCMPIELCYYYRSHFYWLLKCFSLAVASLTDTSVHYKQRLIGLNRCLNLLHLIEQCSLLFVSPGGVNNYNLVLLLPEKSDSFLSYFYWICLIPVTEKRTFNFSRILLELFKSACSKRVCAHQADSPTFLQVVVRILGAGCCFACALESNEHNNVLLASCELWRLVFRWKHVSQFVHHRFSYEFSHVSTPHITIAHLQWDLGFNSVAQRVDVVDVYIWLQQRGSNVCEQFIENLVIHNCCVTDFPKSISELGSKICQNHNLFSYNDEDPSFAIRH